MKVRFGQSSVNTVLFMLLWLRSIQKLCCGRNSLENNLTEKGFYEKRFLLPWEQKGNRISVSLMNSDACLLDHLGKNCQAVVFQYMEKMDFHRRDRNSVFLIIFRSCFFIQLTLENVSQKMILLNRQSCKQLQLGKNQKNAR